MSVIMVLLPKALAAAARADTSSGLFPLGAKVAGSEVALYISNRPTPETVAYETHFTREDLLIEALTKGGYDVERRPAGIVVGMDRRVIIFQREGEGRFQAVVGVTHPEEQLQGFFDALYADYGRAVQARAYQRLLEQARSAGMELEMENVEADNSIALTFKVRA